MAIPSDQLVMWIGDTSITGQPGSGARLGLTWQARHIVLGDVIAQGTLSQSVATMGQLPAVDEALRAQAGGAYAGAVEWHAPIAALNGYSAFDADLILDAWMQNGDEMKHPICGTVAGAPEGLVARVLTILAWRLPPPMWVWAASIAPGELRVRTVAVPGADSYNIYSGEELLGNVPVAGWHTLALPVGTYSVRVAGMKAGLVGILSFPVNVQVGDGVETAMLFEAMDIAPKQDAGKSWLARLWDWSKGT